MPRRARARRSYGRTRESTRSSRAVRAALGGAAMNLTTENTAVVLDSTSDYPEAPVALPEHALRPSVRALRRRDVQGLRGARARRVLREAAHVSRPARDLQPTPQDFLTATRSSPVRADLLACTSPRRSRERSRVPSSPHQEIGGDKVRVVDSLTASLAIAMLAHAIQRRLARGTTDVRDRRARRAVPP